MPHMRFRDQQRSKRWKVWKVKSPGKVQENELLKRVVTLNPHTPPYRSSSHCLTKHRNLKCGYPSPPPCPDYHLLRFAGLHCKLPFKMKPETITSVAFMWSSVDQHAAFDAEWCVMFLVHVGTFRTVTHTGNLILSAFKKLLWTAKQKNSDLSNKSELITEACSGKIWGNNFSKYGVPSL